MIATMLTLPGGALADTLPGDQFLEPRDVAQCVRHT